MTVAAATLLPSLNRNGVLTPMPEASRSDLLAAGHVVRLAAGEAALHQGDESPGIFCILNGQLRFSATDAEGTDFLYYVGYRGVWFGHACIDSGPAVVTASATVPSELFCIPAQAIRHLMIADLHIAQFMLRTMAWLTRIAFGRIRENSTFPSARLVPHVLHQQYLQAIEAGLGKEAANLRLSQTDVSNMCGLSPRSVGRALKTLKDLGAVALRYNSIAILDHQALAQAAGDAEGQPVLGA